jgi:alpha-amylase/alpha-mannosidase (GH57 family)
MASAIPEYRKLLEQDGGELSSTPMYHPILPLLVDTRSAQDALPGAPLPEAPFAYPEDALEQLIKGRESFRSMFGSYPDGLWPSEGSISPAAMDLAARAAFRWAATDEGLLSKAFGGKPVFRDADGVPSDPDWLYRPYRATTPSGPIHLFFRDHHLSDLIGFEYSRWGGVEAVNNFIHKIISISNKLSSLPSKMRKESYVIPIILDGENAWEYFYDSGRLFLRTLMDRLGKLSPGISCITYSQLLNQHVYEDDLPEVPTGSWIDGTFNIWIGHEEDRKAWSMLSRARALWQVRKNQALKAGGTPAPALERAREHLFVAEGSDWCWWYGDDHFTPHAAEFDRLFRHHLKAAYREMGEDAPDSVDIPIIRADRMPAGTSFLASPRMYIYPRINGTVTSYFEWGAATRYIPNPGFGTMHRAGHGILSCLYYGFDESHIYLRADFVDLVFEGSSLIEVEFLFPAKNRKLSLAFRIPDRTLGLSIGPIGETAQELEPGSKPETIRAAFHKVLEIGIPFRELECEHEEKIDFFLTLAAEGMIGERWPMYGTFTAELPGKFFEERMWEV